MARETRELTDAQWTRLAPLLPPQNPRTGRPAKDPRLVVEALCWLGRTGAPWRGGWIIDHFPPTGMLPYLSSNLQQQFLGPHCATCSARQGWYVRSFIDAMNAGNTSLAQEYYSRLFYGYYTAWPWTGGWRLGP